MAATCVAVSAIIAGAVVRAAVDRAAAGGEPGRGPSEPVRPEGGAVQVARPVEPAPVTDRGTAPAAGSAPAEPVPSTASREPASPAAPREPVPSAAPREPAPPQRAAAAAVPVPRDPRDRGSIPVAIDSDPPGAQILVGGRVLGTTPYHGELARQAHDVTFVIRLASYADRTVVARASQAIHEQVKLVHSAAGKPVKPDPDRVVNPF